jgi:hypothetical protein
MGIGQRADLQAGIYHLLVRKSNPGFSYCPVRKLFTTSTELLRLLCKYLENTFSRGGDFEKKWLQLVLPKRRYISTRLHSFTFQKTVTFVTTAISILNANEQAPVKVATV